MVKITCVTENSAKTSSPFWGEHGLSFLIESGQGCVLFDTGQTATILLHNLLLLGKTLDDVDAVVLSHAHNDHTGGLPTVLAQRPGLPVYANPDLGRARFSHKDGRYAFIGLPLPMDALAQLAELRLSAEPVEVLPSVWTTGEIRERPELEGRGPNLFVQDGASWQPDRYQDDLSMVVETQAGLVLVCGCCHAGLLNTLAHVACRFQRQPVAVIGGTHLVSAEGTALQHVIDVLRNRYQPMRLYPNHCTGQQAYVALASAFGDHVHPCPAGTTLTFN
jgi:7,8-dihydropterin-6-yl-methyl-4-(beta-D-ribofuranosyl)aminobenzene 5'-phosphate synthase